MLKGTNTKAPFFFLFVSMAILSVSGCCQVLAPATPEQRHEGTLSSLLKERPSWVSNSIIEASADLPKEMRSLLEEFIRLDRWKAEEYCKGGKDVAEFEQHCKRVLLDHPEFCGLSFWSRCYEVDFASLSPSKISRRVLLQDGSIGGEFPLPTDVEYYGFTTGKLAGKISLEWRTGHTDSLIGAETTPTVRMRAFWPASKSMEPCTQQLQDDDPLVVCK